MKLKHFVSAAVAISAFVILGSGIASAQPFTPTNVTVKDAVSVVVQGSQVANVFAEGKTCENPTVEASFVAKNDLSATLQIQQEDGSFRTLADGGHGTIQVSINTQQVNVDQPAHVNVKAGERVIFRHFATSTDNLYRLVATGLDDTATPAVDIVFASQGNPPCYYGKNDIIYLNSPADAK